MTRPRRITGVLACTVMTVMLSAAGCSSEDTPETRAEKPPSQEEPMASAHGAEGGSNRLAGEKSPYLLQHKDNPVDWYPWGDEAFEAAVREDKPIFLSIGYSTCHWCHVMEHESFENAEVAARMNEAFICIKVDREERPDIDNIYMTVCQMMTQRGGWPLTIIMTPSKQPFFAGTYLPPQQLLQLIPRVTELWQNERGKLVAQGEQITTYLREASRTQPGDALGAGEIDAAYAQLRSRYDATHGGFGDSPKFPTPHNLIFVLRQWNRSGDPQALEMVEKTLEHMRRGGMYDHVGFGFHRYSTDARWFLPHFEKMLYDQAMLAMAYTEAWQATGRELYRRTAEEIYTYVARDMTDAKGGFYSAEDADSEGEEGKFYLWSAGELREVLGDDAGVVMEALGATEAGNYQEEASGHRTGTNILYMERPLDESAAALGITEAELRERLDAMRQRLFDVREGRIHPGKDDKILADWNGLMIAALARSARVFDTPAHAAQAERAARFVLEEMSAPDGGLYHRYHSGSAEITGMIDDYAFVVWGLLELYETTFDIAWLENAIRLSEYANEHFWDESGGGYFFTADGAEALLVRQKEVYDGAIPSGNSVAALNLIRIGRITAQPSWEHRARALGSAFQEQIQRGPSAFSQMLTAVDFAEGSSFEGVTAAPDAAAAAGMRRALDRTYVPRKVVVFRPVGSGGGIVALAPYTREQKAIEGRPTAYVCRNYACELPTTDPDEMVRMLSKQ